MHLSGNPSSSVLGAAHIDDSYVAARPPNRDGCDYLCRSPNRAKRMECVQLAAAFAALRPIQTFGHSRKRQQAARTPYASRGSVTDTNNRTLAPRKFHLLSKIMG